MNIINDVAIQFFQNFYYTFSLAFKIISKILFYLPREKDEILHRP